MLFAIFGALEKWRLSHGKKRVEFCCDKRPLITPLYLGCLKHIGLVYKCRNVSIQENGKSENNILVREAAF